MHIYICIFIYIHRTPETKVPIVPLYNVYTLKDKHTYLHTYIHLCIHIYTHTQSQARNAGACTPTQMHT